MGTGGATSSPTSASQCYAQISSVTLTSGKYLSVKDSGSTALFSYRLPNTVNSGTVLTSSPLFTKSSHTLMYGVTSVSIPTESYFDGTFTIGGQLSGGSSKTKQSLRKSNYKRRAIGDLKFSSIALFL